MSKKSPRNLLRAPDEKLTYHIHCTSVHSLKCLIYLLMTIFRAVLESESEVTQSCLTLCDPMNYSLTGSSVHVISQARVLEWLPFPSPGDLPDPGIKPTSPALGSIFFTTEPPGKPNPIHNSRVFHFHPSQKHLQNAHLYTAPIGRGCVTEPGLYGTQGSWMDGRWFQRACVT